MIRISLTLSVLLIVQSATAYEVVDDSHVDDPIKQVLKITEHSVKALDNTAVVQFRSIATGDRSGSVCGLWRVKIENRNNEFIPFINTGAKGFRYYYEGKPHQIPDNYTILLDWESYRSDKVTALRREVGCKLDEPTT